MNKVEKIYQYVLECIRTSSCFSNEECDTEMSDGECIAWFWEDYERVECYPINLKREPNEAKRIANYIAGCQPTFDVDIFPNKWMDLLSEWGYTDEEIELVYPDFYVVLACVIIRAHKFFCTPF